MPSFTSFTNPLTYTSEIPAAISKLNCALLTGYTFNGVSVVDGAVSKNPGNLFGWLVYSRAVRTNPIKGTTSATYIYYTNPTDFISDLNALDGMSGGVLINSAGSSNTYGFFVKDTTTQIKLGPSGAADEFLYALDYLAYGGNLIIAGATAGLYQFQTERNLPIDLIFGITGSGHTPGFINSQRWLKNEAPSTIGIFPTIDSGMGYTSGALELSNETFVAGATVADRVFVVYGQKNRTNLALASLLTSGTLTYTHTLTADVAGLFTRAKSRNEQFLSIAGANRGFFLNGDVTTTVNWSNTELKSLLKNYRVNYVLNFTRKFLGSDLVGCTYSSSEPIIDERIGPAQLKTIMKRDITNIALRYLYEVNNPTTRTLVVGDIETYMAQYSNILDTTQTEITCDATNNTNNSPTLNIFVSVFPLAGSSSFVLNISLTQ